MREGSNTFISTLLIKVPDNARGDNDVMFRWTNIEFTLNNTLIIKSDRNGIQTHGNKYVVNVQWPARKSN